MLVYYIIVEQFILFNNSTLFIYIIWLFGTEKGIIINGLQIFVSFTAHASLQEIIHTIEKKKKKEHKNNAGLHQIGLFPNS